jgi:hypothetical protein
LFHPLGDESDAPRWADVAAHNHRVLHPSAEWENISRPPGAAIPDGPTGRGYPGEPFTGTLFTVFLAPLCELLASHTTTPDLCWFGIWDGWGWWGPQSATSTAYAVSLDASGVDSDSTTHGSWPLDVSAPRFSLPYREYLLYAGAVEDAPLLAPFEEQSPSLFWPDDHAWCVATEVDFDTTLIGGSQALVDALVRSPNLEALQIDVGAPFGDQINT